MDGKLVNVVKVTVLAYNTGTGWAPVPEQRRNTPSSHRPTSKRSGFGQAFSAASNASALRVADPGIVRPFLISTATSVTSRLF